MSDGKLHSKLGASSYDRWGACPGSVRASEGITNESSIYAEEGTKAHDFASKFLLAQPIKEEIEDEMMDAIQVYLDHIASLRDQKPSFESVEQKLSLAEYHPALFGTADYVCYFEKTRTLHVVDYKHGRGIPVSVEKSKQLMYYGLGALHMNKFAVENVVLTIVQPRCFHRDGPIRSYVCDTIEMLDFAADLIADAKKTEAENAPLVAGEHCRFCPAQPTCPVIQERAIQVTKAAFKDESLPSVSPERLAEFLALIPQIKAWCESVHVYAHQQAALGFVPPGWKLVDKVARRKWLPDTNAFTLAQTFDKDESKFFDPEPAMLSPAQVEKMLTKPQKAMLEKFVIKESSGKTLVQTADDREPVAGKLESAFKQE